MEEEETAKVEDKKTHYTKSLILASVTTSIGFLQYGYNFWVLHFPSVILVNFYNDTEEHLRDEGIHQNILLLIMVFAIALYPLGGLVGCLLFAPLADVFGRTYTMMINNLFSIACAVLMGFSKMVEIYEFSMFSRFITGVCSGISSSIIPVYLTEIAPKNLRGSINMMASSFLVLGMLLAQVFSAPHIFGNEKGWPILMSFAGFVALFQMLPLFYIPDSPRYLLIQKKQEEKARQVLIKLRGQDNVEEEMEDLRQEDMTEKPEKNMTILKLIHFPGQRSRFIIILILHFAQQFAGYSAVYYYVDGIYLSTGVKKDMLQTLHMATFSSLAVITVVSMLTIDSVGRKTLLLTGFGVCNTCCAFLTITIQLQKTHSWLSFVNTILIIAFLLGHFIGPGTIPHLLVAELFLQSSRCSAFSASGTIFWFCRVVATMTLGGIEEALRAYAFLLYLPVGLATSIFVFMFIQETKQKTFLEIRKLYTIPETKKKAFREIRNVWGTQRPRRSVIM